MDGLPCIRGEIQHLSFQGECANLPSYKLDDFDINVARPVGLAKLGQRGSIAYSRWVSPKRTRSYPFARIWDTLGFSGKIVTVIPIIKDEGRGERRNDSNLDRITYMTYSWMNLMNVYIILAWYCEAKSLSSVRITQQLLDSKYVRSKLHDIADYKYDAHHWNRMHFENDFLKIYRRAIDAYVRIANKLNIKLHSRENHCKFIESVCSDCSSEKLDLEKFRTLSLDKSLRSAQHEVQTVHTQERLSTGNKALFCIRNNLGGIYHLTADEVLFTANNKIVIRECKHTSRHILPSLNDIKDGLFKLLLFSRLVNLRVANNSVTAECELRLTSDKLQDVCTLPSTAESTFTKFIRSNRLSDRHADKLVWLDKQSQQLGIRIIIGSP